MTVNGTPVHVVLYGLDGLSRHHGPEEGGSVRVGQRAVLQLFGSLVILRLPLVVVLDLGAHPGEPDQRGKLLNVLEQDDVPVLPGEILGLPHEEDVAAAGLLPFGGAPLLHLALGQNCIKN